MRHPVPAPGQPADESRLLQWMVMEFWNLLESHLRDVFDVDSDVDNGWTLRRQFELNVVLGHTDALSLEKGPLRKEEETAWSHRSC